MDQEGSRGAEDPGRSGSDELLLVLREHGIRERVVEALPDAVVVLDANGIVADLNHRAKLLLGRSVDERVDAREVIVPDDGSALGDAGERPVAVTIHRSDGSTANAFARSVAIVSEPEPLSLVLLTELGGAEEAVEGGDPRSETASRAVATGDAERLRRRVERLQAITDAALVHLSLDQLFDALLTRLRHLLGADSATVLLLDPHDRVLRVRASSGLERPTEENVDVPLGAGIAGRIASGRRPVIIGDVRRARSVSPFLHRNLRSLVGVPILHRGAVTGVLHVGSVQTRRFTEDDVSLLEIVAARLAPAIENAQLHEAERVARAAAEQDAARLRLVRDVTEVLGTMRPVAGLAQAAIERIGPELGAIGATVVLLAQDGRSLSTVAFLGYDDMTRERWRDIPLDAPVPVVACILEGRVILLGSRAELENAFPATPEAPAVGSSWVLTPLVVDGRALGALTLSFPDERGIAEHDLEVLDAVAHQVAQAMDRARRYDAERRSAQRAAENANRLRLLQSLTARYSRALTPREVASITVSEAAASLGAPSGVFLLLDDEGMFALQASHGYSERALAGWQRFPADLPTPAGDAVRTGELVIVTSLEDLVERYPLVAGSLAGRPIGPTAAIPLLVDERAIGSAAFTFGPDRELSNDDRELLRALGRHAGQALERARLYETERQARRAAEQSREWTERLQALAIDLVDAETANDVARLLSEHVLAALGGSASAVMRLREADRLEIVASRGYLPEILDRYRALELDSRVPVTDAIRTDGPVWIGSREELAHGYPDLVERWDEIGSDDAFAAIPLRGGDRVLGVVGVQFAEPRTWTGEDRAFLEAIVRQCAQAIERIELRGARQETLAELEREERRFRSLVESTTTIHWTVDPAGAFVEPQRSWEDYTGQAWEDHRGFGWLDAHHPDDRASLMEGWVAARDGGTLYRAEARLWHAASGEHRHTISRAAPVRDDDGRVVEWIGTINDVHDRNIEEAGRAERENAARSELEQAGERLAYLAAASTVLASSLEMDQTLQRLAELAVPRLADWCTIDMLDPDGTIRLVAVAHVDPKKVELAYEMRERYPPDPDDATGMPAVLRTGRSFLLEEIPEALLEEAKQRNPEMADLVDQLQLRSAMTVPIAVGERVLGAMTFVWAESGQTYDREDLSLAEDLGHRAAVAIENARLFEAERAARREEARVRERFQLIAEAGSAMTVTLDPRRVVEALARTTARRISDVSVVYLLDRAGTIEDFVAAHHDASLESLVRRATSLRFPVEQDQHGSVAQVLRTGERVLAPRITERDLAAAELTEEQRAVWGRFAPLSEIAVPLPGRGRMLGVLAMMRSADRPAFVDDDLQLATDLARRAGLMIENARLYAERDEVAETLQRSLLPPDLFEVPGLDIAARYLPAQGLTVGGDFYDVFELDLDHLGVVIGDVVGKGAAAAAMMALARYTIRTAAMAETRPSALLRTLNDAMLLQTRESMFCTASFARVKRSDGGARVTLSVGGHPLPMIVGNDGSVDPFGEPGTLLGIFEDPTLADRVIDLKPGDALVLYTDGVTDERNEDEEFGEARLRSTLASLAGADAQGIVDGVVDTVNAFRSGHAHDDIALLVIRVRPEDTR